MTDPLQMLRRANFDWTVMLQNIWSPPLGDVPQIQEALRREFQQQIEDMCEEPARDSPAGWVLTGSGGAGKTHLLGRFREQCAQRRVGFVLVDMTDVKDFWDTVLLGYFTSLQQPIDHGSPQFHSLMENILGQVKWTEEVQHILAVLKRRKTSDLKGDCEKILSALYRQFPREVPLYSDTIRALIALNSQEYSTSNLGATWLQGEAIETSDKLALGISKEAEQSRKIVEGLAWLMSLSGPTVVALDQLDPIVTQFALQLAPGAANSQDDPNTAKSILNQIGAGLSALRDATTRFRTLIVISCVELSWNTLKTHALRSYTDRYEPARVLTSPGDVEAARLLIDQRLAPAFANAGFVPPYSTWPFANSAIEQLRNDTPREILQKCKEHVQHCIRRGTVEELQSFQKHVPSPPEKETGSEAAFLELDRMFFEIFKGIDIKPIIDERQEDERFAELIQLGLQFALKESSLPPSVDGIVDTTFTGGTTTKPLHARLRLVFNEDHSREEHVCFRILQKTNASAFQSRLKSAMTQSGIDKSIRYRRLVVIRTEPFPSGSKSQELKDRFEKLGGFHLIPDEADLRTLAALKNLSETGNPLFDPWMASRRRASKTELMQQAIPRLFDLSPLQENQFPVSPASASPEGSRPHPAPPTTGAVSSTSASLPLAEEPLDGSSATSPLRKPAADEIILPLGHQLIGDTIGPPVKIPIASLSKHGIIFAGAGSGKTVLLKRLIEEAALAGIPAIVIDCANDLCSLGDAWPASPTHWSQTDTDKAARLRTKTETVVWTPGRDSGNPLGLAPLPDLTSLADVPDELQDAIVMATDSLDGTVVTGTKTAIAKRRAILTGVFHYLARQGGCNLEMLAEILCDLPPEASSKISDERKVAKAMADDLRAQLVTNPLLRSRGPILDPALLFGDDAPQAKTRISIISFVGLPTLEEQRQFLNQLAMTLFAWIKKHPRPPERPLRGLLILDEARDFVPSQKASACLGSLQRLAAQARKYSLGVLFATQNPKDIDNKIVGQCSTQWYGKMNSPVAIQAAADMLSERGLPGAEVGALKQGRFIVSNADTLPKPLQVMTPLCLSQHAGPWEVQQILAKAARSRRQPEGHSVHSTVSGTIGSK